MTFPKGPLSISPLQIPQGTSPFIWEVPGSKSITNRALVLAALAEGESILRGVLHSDDTRHMRTGLEQMGIDITEVDSTTWKVIGGRSRLRAPEAPIFVGNSGTTVRFLAALAALVPGEVTLTGDEHMAKRPILDLVDGLRQLGISIDCDSGCPPLTITGGSLPTGRIEMPGNKSSQYFSAVLMAAPGAQGPLEIIPQGTLVSRPYIDITLAMMKDFGASVTETSAGFRVDPSELTAREYKIEPDASSASYAFATAAITGIPIEVPGLTTGALQGDYAFVDLLAEAGATVEKLDSATRVSATEPLRGLDVDMHHISDTVMTLAAIAPVLQGPTRITNVANIRIKETDRLAATVAELRRLGQQVDHGDDWFSIKPAPITAAEVLSYADHRMAMSFAVLGLVREGIAIEDPPCVAKTYPTFWDDLDRLREFVAESPQMS